MLGKASHDGNRKDRGRVRRWLVSYPRAVPVAIFAAIAAITVLSVFAIESGARAKEKLLMRDYAQSVALSLSQQGNASSSYLRAGAALFASIDDASLPLFRQFVGELQFDTGYAGADGIGWAKAFGPGVIGDTSRSAPVTYLSPQTERNRRAIGFDLYSEPVRSAAMDEAKRTARPTSSGKLVLAQEGAGDAPGFLIFMPVYMQGDDGRELKGFIYSPFNALDFLDAAVALVDEPKMGVRLFDGNPAPENLLAEHAVQDPSGEVVRQDVDVANRAFVLEIESVKSATLAPLSMVTLLFGLAVASLLMVLARLLTKQANEDQLRLEFFEQQNSIRNSLTRELNHRVKNTLANVLSILSLTRRRAKNLDEFASSLEGRIRALSATHDLLTQSEWGTSAIEDVIEAEMAHIHQMKDHEVTLSGPPVELAPNDALSFGLAVHELSTNAAKYGALSAEGGAVSVTWELEQPDLAAVEWREMGGPPVVNSGVRGFGTELIEKIVAHELKNPVTLEFRPDGVRCVLRVPVRRRSDFEIREKQV